MCACLLLSDEFAAIVVSVYAYPRGNPNRSANEDMLTDLFSWAATLTLPILIGGDMNDTVDSSPPLAPAFRSGLFPLSPTTLSTTKTKDVGKPGNERMHVLGKASL